MLLSQVDRMSALILAKSIYTNNMMLSIRGELESRIVRLSDYHMFSMGELADFSHTSIYKVKKIIPANNHTTYRSGVLGRHLDDLIRMVADAKFGRRHIDRLLEEGATPDAIARIIGVPPRTVRGWRGEEFEDRILHAAEAEAPCA